MEPGNELLYLRVRAGNLEAELAHLNLQISELQAKVVRQRQQLVVLARANQRLKKQLGKTNKPSQ
jgi:hypothetical protein